MAKYAAKGSILKIENSTPGTYITVGQLKSIGGPALSRDTIDVTTLDSAGGYKEYIASWRDGGEMPVSGIFDPADLGQAEFLEDIQSTDVARNWEVIVGATGKKFTFKAFVTQFEVQMDTDGALEFSGSLKITGAVVLANVAP